MAKTRSAAEKILKKKVEKDDLNVLSREHLEQAENIIIEVLQWELLPELEKTNGEYRNLSPKKEGSLWKVGERMQRHVGFTRNNEMPVLLPRQGKGTELIMKKCHNEQHGGCDQTLVSFRLAGYWAPHARKLARKIRMSCAECNKENPKMLSAKMGDHKKENLEATDPFQICQLDLFGPYQVKIGRREEKRWGLCLMDVVSNATFIDIVQDYSAAAVQMTLSRFGSVYGWPEIISSDPGSQLVSAAGKLESWWLKMKNDLALFAGTNGFKWIVSAPDCPWRQGKTEQKIGKIKRLLRIVHGTTVLSPDALQTAFFKIADICNKVPITLQRAPDKDGNFAIIRPMDLLRGRATGVMPIIDGSGLKDSLVCRNLKDVAEKTRQFYKNFATLASPRLLWSKKWRIDPEVTVGVGDVVRVLEPSKFKNNFTLAKVIKIEDSHDNKVRTATVEYATTSDGKVVKRSYKRAVQRLSLVAKATELENDQFQVIKNDLDEFVVRGLGNQS